MNEDMELYTLYQAKTSLLYNARVGIGNLSPLLLFLIKLIYMGIERNNDSSIAHWINCN